MAHAQLKKFLIQRDRHNNGDGYFCLGIDHDKCPLSSKDWALRGCRLYCGWESASPHLEYILKSEATWRLWMELQGNTPENKWEEEK